LKPIVLAWNGPNHNHFVPLVGVHGFPEPELPFFPAVEGEGLNSKLCATKQDEVANRFDYKLRSQEVDQLKSWKEFYTDFRELVCDLANVHVFKARKYLKGFSGDADDKFFEQICQWHNELDPKALWQLYVERSGSSALSDAKSEMPPAKRPKLEHDTSPKAYAAEVAAAPEKAQSSSAPPPPIKIAGNLASSTSAASSSTAVPAPSAPATAASPATATTATASGATPQPATATHRAVGFTRAAAPKQTPAPPKKFV
jgi:hypothetical protein